MYNNLQDIKIPISKNQEISIHLIQIDQKLDQILISIDKNKEKELDYYPLSDLAREIDKSNQTIRYHLIANFEPGVDFKKENGKIYINKHIVPLIKEHYEKK